MQPRGNCSCRRPLKTHWRPSGLQHSHHSPQENGWVLKSHLRKTGKPFWTEGEPGLSDSPCQTPPWEQGFLPQCRQHKQMNRTTVLSTGFLRETSRAFTATIHYQQSIPTCMSELALQGKRCLCYTFQIHTQSDTLCGDIIAGSVVLR